MQRQKRSRYSQRLEHFRVVVVTGIVWILFVALALRVWGWSLLGLGGARQLDPRLSHALLGVAVTALIAWLVWIFADSAIERALNGGARGRRQVTARAQTIIPMIRNAMFFAVLIVAAIVGLANLGVNITPLLAGAGIIGLAVGFGAQTLVHDVITGVFILVEDTMAVGDWVQINGLQGSVEKMNLRSVYMRDLDGTVNSIIFSQISAVQNMSRNYGFAMLYIRIPHDMRIQDAVQLMKDTGQTLRTTPEVRSLLWGPLEFQGVQSYEEGCPMMRMCIRTAPVWQWYVGRMFNQLLKEHMDAQQVTLGAPRMSIRMEAGGGQHQRINDAADPGSTNESGGTEATGRTTHI